MTFHLVTTFLLTSLHVSRASLACVTNPCIYGICIESSKKTLVGGSSGYTCYCIDGYTGVNCQTNWDECWSAPCLNGGTCTDGIAYFNCTCQEGFIGDTCEENINECGSNPCLNNGTCVDIANGYMCSCSPGYSGYNCEMDMAVCNTTDETRCANGGTCIEGPGITFSCRCLPGWSGRLCELPVDECSSSPCENGGVCIDMHAMYVCACPYGYTGMNCETQVELCLTNTCENGALCVVEGRTSICYCVPDYHGERCQFRYDECQKGPGCLNGGTCIDGVDSYTCSCSEEFTGRFCECQIGSSGYLNCNFFYTVVPPVTEPPKVTTPTTSTTVTSSVSINMTRDQTFSTIFTDMSTREGFTTWATDITTLGPIYFSTDVMPLSSSTFEAGMTQTDETTTFDPITQASQEIQTVSEGLSFTTESTSLITDSSYEASSTSVKDEVSSQLPPNEGATSMTTEPSISMDTKTSREEWMTTEFIPSPFPLSTEVTSWVFGTTPTAPTFPDIFLPTEGNYTTPRPMDWTTKAYLSTEFDWETTTPRMVFRGTTEETPFSTEVGLDCFRIPCLSGGTCTNTTQGPRCLCNFGWKGKFCEDEEGIKIAAFRGRSYLLHVFGNSTKTAVALKMRTLTESGIILYAHVSASVYMALYLQQGYLRFQFSCGVQTMLFSELKYSINSGYEMHVLASLDLQVENGVYRHCNGSVKLNGTLSMSGKQEAYLPFFGPKLNGALYLGGLSHQLHSQVDLPVKKGLTACMHSLTINDRSREIYGGALDGMDITECDSLACLSNPCQNSATCIEIGHNWSCLCSSGYLGMTCERSVCMNNPCKFGGTCVQYPGSGFLCLCPLGKHGMFCDQDLEIGHPQFSASVSGLSSYIAYPLPGPIHHSFELHFRFLPSTLDQIGLMVFIGQGHPHDSSSDHLAVSFIKGYVVLTWNLGSGPRRIFTPQSILGSGKPKEVHMVRLGRSGQTGWLQVDSMPNVTGTSPGWLTQLNTRPLIYLGGHESRNFSGLPHDLPLHAGFSGCLYDVELRAGKVRLQIQRSRDAVGRNVGQCLTKHCHNSTCLNRGACMDHGATYACLCQDGWFSPGCAMRYNPCDSSHHNCSKGSTCVPLTLGYECDCPLGKSGQFCEKEEKLSDVGFTGKRSFMSLPPAALDLTETCIDLEIRPATSRGIILFSAQQHGPSISFISLSLHGGVIELRLQPTGGHRRSGDVLVVRSAQVVALSQWTRVRAGRYGRRIYLWVDGTVNSGSLLPGEIMLPSHSPLYIGGTEDMSTLPSGAVAGLPIPFSGCVRRLFVNWRSLPLDEQFIIDARNIHDCDGTACGGDVCTNGGSCWITPDNKPMCTCQRQYYGERCEKVVSCEQVGCEHKGRCVSQGRTRSCSCAIGWSGPFCDQEVGQGAPHFGGNSYLVVDSRRAVSKREDEQSPKTNALYAKLPEETNISYLYINFSTAQHDGMLLWTSKNDDFLGLGVETGMMKVIWGKSSADRNELLLPGTSVADGSWHTLTISYHARTINFWADRTVAQSYPSNSSLQTDGVFYIGGFPEGRRVVEETGGSFHSRFSGCVREMILNDFSSIVDFSQYDGENLGSCDLMYP